MINSELPEPIEFEWDERSQAKSLVKHRITKIEAEEAFFRDKLIQPDERHRRTEPRFGMYGQADKGKILFIAFSIRKGRIRIISARPANKKERETYEKTFKKAA